MTLLSLTLLMAPALADWTVDTARAKIEFSIKGPFGTVHGNFTGLKATIRFDVKDPRTGSITASIDAKTVSTGIGLRNHHLRTEEQFLNTDKYPVIGYRSKAIEKTPNGFTSTGELTIKGITKPVRIPFTFAPNGTTGVFKGQFVIRREDFDIGKPGGSIGDDVTINLEVPVSQ